MKLVRQFAKDIEMAENCGKELRKFIKTFTDLDTFELVKNYNK